MLSFSLCCRFCSGKHGKRSRTESLAAVYGYVYDDEYASPYETDQDYKADAADAADLNKLSKRTRAEENTDLLGAIFNSFRGGMCIVLFPSMCL